MRPFSTLAETALHRATGPLGRLAARLDETRYHMRQARLCDAIIADVGRRQGRALDAASARQAEDYAAAVLGWRGHAPWLKVYALIAGGFREGWIPDTYYNRIVLPAINAGYRHMAQMRQVALRLFPEAPIPDSIHVARGRFFAPGGDPVAPGAAAAAIFARGERTIFKANGSGLGQSIRVLRREEFEPEATWPDGVFQHFIAAHADLARFYPGATATLRLTTALNPAGEPELRAAYMRLARAGDTYVRGQTLLRVPLDPATGAFAAEALLADWSRAAAHPDSGAGFDGARVPEYAAAVALVCGLHRSFPMVGCVGWDIAIDEAGRPWLLEWNAVHNDIKVSEMTSGPCFRGLGWEDLWRGAAAG